MKTIVEAGHYYQVNGPSALSLQGWEIGKSIVASNQDAELVLFVDDYHREQSFLEPCDMFLEPEEAACAASKMVEEADHVFYETAIVQTATEKINELLENGFVKLKKGVLSVGGIRLGCLRRL